MRIAAPYSLFPNPSTDYLNITSQEYDSQLQTATFSVLNTQGQELFRQRVDNNRIDISQLPSGIYLLQLPELKILRRFVKR